ncbi:MAG: HET domain-containing protein, partial [Janthinobacterium lividum]
KTEPTAVAFGGRLRPLQVDLDWIRQWLTISLNEHGEQCSSPAVSNDAATGRATLSVPDQREFANIRLINVILNCIETFQHDQCDDQRLCPPYVALSYVWGHDQPLKLQIGNEHTLSRPDALLRDRPTLTITDAMELLSRLSWPGVQHLWVDALCIIQDSDDDKKRQIGNMAQIYTNAAFTIVAAAGEDAAAGLPGLHAGTRSVTQTAVLLSEPERAVYPFDSLNCYGNRFCRDEHTQPASRSRS